MRTFQFRGMTFVVKTGRSDGSALRERVDTLEKQNLGLFTALRELYTRCGEQYPE